MSEFSLQRRNALKILGVALGAPLVGPLLFKALAVEAGHKNDVSDFLRVSASILGVSISALDSDIARVYWAKLSKTPKARTLLSSLSRAVSHRDSLINSESQLPGDEVRGFAKKIILLWYTGVFESPPGHRERLFYGDSFMFKFFSKDRPAPGLCSGAPETWTKPPTA